MADNKEYMSQQDEMGAIHISEDVIASIASSTALEIEGVSSLISEVRNGKKGQTKGIRIETDGEDISVNITISVNYGITINEVAEKVQQSVYNALESITGFQVKAVNVHVGGISFT